MDVGQVIRETQARVAFLLGADRAAAEVIDILRDTHRILAKLESTVDRLDAQAREVEEKFADFNVDAKRLDRLEEAVLNIERATLGLEAAMTGLLNAMPRAVQQRIERSRRQPSY